MTGIHLVLAPSRALGASLVDPAVAVLHFSVLLRLADGQMPCSLSGRLRLRELIFT